VSLSSIEISNNFSTWVFVFDRDLVIEIINPIKRQKVLPRGVVVERAFGWVTHRRAVLHKGHVKRTIQVAMASLFKRPAILKPCQLDSMEQIVTLSRPILELVGKTLCTLRLHAVAVITFGGLALATTGASSQILGEGGSNYIAFGLPSATLQVGANWRDSSFFKTPACQLNQNEAAVSRELRLMRSGGQRKVALVLWFMHQAGNATCTGFALNSASGMLSESIVANLRDFVKIARDVGLDEVEVRFAPLVRNSPREWTVWNSSMFQENWRVVDQVHTALSGSSAVKVTYDLGVELGGVEEEHCGQCSQYTRMLWDVYTKKFLITHLAQPTNGVLESAK
jgi:hypothetical protein